MSDVDDEADGSTGGSADDAVEDPLADLDASEHPVLLFDGVCNLCNGIVRFVVRFDDAGTFRFAPLQSAVGRALLERHGIDAGEFDSFVLVEGDEAYEKSTAALRVARGLDGPWPLFRPLLFLPERLRDATYDLVAANRYRVFGRTDECQLPPPELRERFAERALEGLDGSG
ncbi:thiol-disulfide oxidoreductase DCC family protein [Halorarum salinum]|uniref:Thiol-disulfide oxidoreductase DCC family protein n=1 Tax=Halorarum salinum TaxID=2743089 RepID=A0A7D5QM48_9EURY|nr:thiol-disulfide oxidoreductase DCC family protein [Halobaculum salinum]QLG63225.1 thiol-disulfide oxidoreductase DCC family protein [Halobaculum salinum]